MTRRVLAPLACLVLVLASCASPEPTVTTAPASAATTTGSPSASGTSSADTTPMGTAPTSTTPAPSTTQASPTQKPSPDTTAADGAGGSGCHPGSDTTLPDGVWFGNVTAHTDNQISFDLACWFTGEAAVQAAAEDGEESPPPNGYYVRNNNEATRELTVSPGATTHFYPDGNPNPVDGDFEQWVEVLDERGPYFGVWVQMRDDQAVSMDEQWTP